MARRLTVLAIVFSVLTVANYILWPVVSARALFVNFFGSLALLFAVWLLLLVVARFIRGQRSKTWAGVALGVLLLDVLLAAGLDFYAGAKTAASLPVLQSYYAEVADAVSLGNLVQAGSAPSGVTFATVKAQADTIQNQLATLDVPGPLAAYAGAIDDWANTVSMDAKYAKLGFWHDVPYQPDPFLLPMTASQADAATTTAMGQIATLIAYDQYARATSNKEGERYIGARLDAQAYWLQAIYSSADPRWPSAQLRFAEPIDNYPALIAVAAAAGLTAGGKTWPPPRAHWASCSRNQHGHVVACNIPQVLSPLAIVWKADINPPNTYSTPAAPVAAAQSQLATLSGSGGQPITGAGSGQESTKVNPPAKFASRCAAQGGHIGNPVYDRTVSRVPTSEGGWTCRTKNDRCFDLLTYSGSEYKGDGAVLDNGSAGCPESGLKPARLLPHLSLAPAPKGTSTPAPNPSSWDGAYTVAASNMHCSGTATGPDGKQFNTSTDYPLAGTFTVRGNVIQGQTPVPISARGEASVVVPITGGPYSGSVTDTLLFVHGPNGSVSFSGSAAGRITFSSGGVAGKFACSGPISGTRN